jgi:hypothetical protein
MYWWSRYGSYRLGAFGLPHMGDVITDYSVKRGFLSQEAFAIAAGVTKRMIDYWENTMYLAEIERRIFLSKLLRIPPALLGLAVYSVLDDNVLIEEHTDKLKRMTELAEEDSYYTYEDILVLGWECVYNGRALEIAPRINRRFRKLIDITKNAPAADQEAWQYLLCQFYQLHTHIKKYHGVDDENKKQVLQGSAEAVQIATDLDDARLIAATLLRDSGIHMEYDLAKKTIRGALDRIEHVGTPLKVDIYLFAANAHVMFTENDTRLEEDIKRWLDTALNTVYKGKMEDDSSFLRPNLAGIHHEKAKIYLEFFNLHPKNPQHLKDARHELNLAWSGLTPGFAEWRMHFALTESRLFLAERNIEGAAKIAMQAVKQAKFIQSMQGEEQAKELYYQLRQQDKRNSYIVNLGVQLGIF